MSRKICDNCKICEGRNDALSVCFRECYAPTEIIHNYEEGKYIPTDEMKQAILRISESGKKYLSHGNQRGDGLLEALDILQSIFGDEAWKNISEG